MRYALLLLLALQLLDPFSKETNFMSLAGFDRWKRFEVTRTWGPLR